MRITDQGRQFESVLFQEFAKIMGISKLRTSPYHPAANGLIERQHRTIKAAIKCHTVSNWVKALPTVLLGLRTVLKEDLGATTSEMVYGTTLKLPGEFFENNGSPNVSESYFLQYLREHFRIIRPVLTNHHNSCKKVFVHKDFRNCTHVFVRTDAVKTGLQQPYTGPFLVKEKFKRNFRILIKGKERVISIDRLKPAFVQLESDNYLSNCNGKLTSEESGNKKNVSVQKSCVKDKLSY